MNELHLFAGAGGGILGGLLLGHRPVCAVEIEPYPRKVLLQRQRDEILPRFPIWNDITTFDGKPWRGRVDVVCGGFPCQDISSAGKGAGIDGARSGLWFEMLRVVREARPKYVFVENSPALTIRGLGTVLGGLAQAGYDARWCVLGGNNVNLPVKRSRIWILASSNLRGVGFGGGDASTESESRGRSDHQRRRGTTNGETLASIRMDSIKPISLERWEEAQPEFLRASNGLANRLDRKRAIGNGQVPILAATAFRILINE